MGLSPSPPVSSALPAVCVRCRKHVPFLSFKSFAASASRCAQVRDGAAFWSQAEGGSLPQYVFFTPNQVGPGAAEWHGGPSRAEPNSLPLKSYLPKP